MPNPSERSAKIIASPARSYKQVQDDTGSVEYSGQLVSRPLYSGYSKLGVFRVFRDSC
jgi:hypothetical protein